MTTDYLYYKMSFIALFHHFIFPEPRSVISPPQVDRPPSEIDNQLYYAIANYPPPTYEEAMSHSQSQASITGQSQVSVTGQTRDSSNTHAHEATNQGRDVLANQGRDSVIRAEAPVIMRRSASVQQQQTMRNSAVVTQPGDAMSNSVSNVPPNQNRYSAPAVAHSTHTPLQYPPPLSRQRSREQNRIELRNSVNMGNPDMGLGILSQAGVVPARNSVNMDSASSSVSLSNVTLEPTAGRRHSATNQQNPDVTQLSPMPCGDTMAAVSPPSGDISTESQSKPTSSNQSQDIKNDKMTDQKGGHHKMYMGIEGTSKPDVDSVREGGDGDKAEDGKRALIERRRRNSEGARGEQSLVAYDNPAMLNVSCPTAH